MHALNSDGWLFPAQRHYISLKEEQYTDTWRSIEHQCEFSQTKCTCCRDKIECDQQWNKSSRRFTLTHAHTCSRFPFFM